MCRPQNIMVCLGKRCKANCTFSAEKYTWFTVWKLPPSTISCVHLQQSKQNIKDQSSSPPQTSGSFKTHLRSLSVHYQSIFIDIGMSVLSQYIVAPTHTVRHKCDKGNRGPLSPVMRHQAGKAKFPEMTSKTIRLSHVLHVFCSQEKSKLWLPIQRLYSVSKGPSHLDTVCFPLWLPNLLRGSLYHPSIFFFSFFFAVTFQLLLFSKQVLLKDSH